MVEVANLRITLEWFLEIAGTNKMKSFSLNFNLLNEATFPVFSSWLYKKSRVNIHQLLLWVILYTRNLFYRWSGRIGVSFIFKGLSSKFHSETHFELLDFIRKL